LRLSSLSFSRFHLPHGTTHVVFEPLELVEKLAALIGENDLKSLTVAIMTVPCCGGLRYMVEKAVALSGVDIPFDTVVVGIDGQIVDQP